MSSHVRSRSAGVLGRSSVPDLRRVVDLHRQTAAGITLTSAQHRDPSITVLQPATATTTTTTATSTSTACDVEKHERDEQLEMSHNGVVTNHHHHHHQSQQHDEHQITAAAASSTVKIDEVFKITDSVPVNFDDVFVQPEALRNGDIGRFLTVPVRRVFGFVFIYSQEAVYYFLSVVTGLFLGVAWGSLFGLLDFMTVWLAQPIIAVYCVLLRIVSMPIRSTVRCLFDPLFQSTAQSLRHIAVRCIVQSAMTRTARQTGSDTAPVEWLGYV